MRIDSSGNAVPASKTVAVRPSAPGAAVRLEGDRFQPRVLAETEGVERHWKSRLPGVLRWALTAAGALVGDLSRKAAELVTKPAPAADAASPRERAQSAWQSMTRHFGVAGQPGLFREHAGSLKPATVWPHGQGVAAALDLAQLTGDYKTVDVMMKSLSLYTQDGAYAPGMDALGRNRLWDDNAWVGLDFMQAYAQTGNKEYVKAAEAIFPFMQAGLHQDGGLYWQENNPRMTRNTCGNGPAIQMALRLYMATKDAKYLEFAKNIDQFLNAELRSPEGLYYDNLGDDGRLDKTIYSYNQGAPVGADVLFYRVTGDKKYLERATQTANAALDHFAKDDRLWKQAPAFNAIFFRNLLALDQVAPNPRYRAALEQYLDRAWKEGRDAETGLFGMNGMGSYTSGKQDYLDQAGLVQLYALLAWPREKLIDVA